ncbi:unnamed protein product, partial [Didymodactylos carnosus]
AWILTAGLNNGVSKLVGEGISRYRLLAKHPKRVTAIGLTMWGSLTDDTRELLNEHSKSPSNSKVLTLGDSETLEWNHTHFLLLDDGQLRGYLSDLQRSSFVQAAVDDRSYPVTIIVEGGKHTLEVIVSDLGAYRPVVIIQIMLKENRRFLNVFRLDRDTNFADSVSKAIFSAYTGNTNANLNESRSRSVKWDCLDAAKELFERKRNRDEESKIKKNTPKSPSSQIVQSARVPPLSGVSESVDDDNSSLFTTALKEKKSAFVDYFLRTGVNPCSCCVQNGILQWYEHSFSEPDETDYITLRTTFDRKSAPTSFQQLNKVYAQWIGSFMDDLYVIPDKKGFRNVRRFGHDISDYCTSLLRHLCSCCPFIKPYHKLTDKSNDVELRLTKNQMQASGETNEWTEQYKNRYTKDEMIRDLFLWSLFTTEIDMAKVFLKHLKPRICAALIATRIYKHFSKQAPNAFAQQKLKEQAEEFEEFATECVETCYAHDEKMTCELLIREVPLFGNVTCMQVAVAGECAKFFATPCVDELLNQIWYDKLTLTNIRSLTQPLILVNLLTLGLLASCWMPYRNIDIQKHDQTTILQPQITDKEAVPDKNNYMMLYKFDAPSETEGRMHWTEIYVIITISALLCEELRQLHDLSAFIYIIFIFIAAYGVVSRSMISYGNVDFSGRGIFSNILYPPYWFLYGNTGDELSTLDNMINGDNSTSTGVAEATATHVLLAIHTLFIQILLLNLLIAVFNSTIVKVEENTEFFWRYQRYSFVRKYFERPLFAYPPLNIISYFFWALNNGIKRIRRLECWENRVDDANIKRKHLTQMIANDPEKSDAWNEFENAATYYYVQSAVEKKKIQAEESAFSDPIQKTEVSRDMEASIRNLKMDVLSTRMDVRRLTYDWHRFNELLILSLQEIMQTDSPRIAAMARLNRSMEDEPNAS